MLKQPLWAAFAAFLCAATPASAQQAQADFPDGPGKQTFINFCGGCHDINRSRAGYTPEGWHTVMRMMLNFDVPVPKDEVDTLIQYLIKSFPERPRPAAVIIPGPVEAAVKLWQVPTPGSRPHDPLATRDGAIWYTGQLSGKLGRLDPKTGVIKEYPLKTPQTGRHGLVRGFLARSSRAARSRDRRAQGMAFAKRTEVGALRHRLHQGRALVQ